jgi:hypothetical protein
MSVFTDQEVPVDFGPCTGTFVLDPEDIGNLLASSHIVSEQDLEWGSLPMFEGCLKEIDDHTVVIELSERYFKNKVALRALIDRIDLFDIVDVQEMCGRIFELTTRDETECNCRAAGTWFEHLLRQIVNLTPEERLELTDDKAFLERAANAAITTALPSSGGGDHVER